MASCQAQFCELYEISTSISDYSVGKEPSDLLQALPSKINLSKINLKKKKDSFPKFEITFMLN